MTARQLNETIYLFRRWIVDDGERRRLLVGRQLLEHGGEFELVEKGAACAHVRGLSAHLFQVEFDRHFAVDGHQLLAKQHRLAVVLKRFAVGLAFHLRSTVEHGFDAAELLDQFDRALVSDSRRARNVIDGVSAQGHHVDDLLRRYPEYFHHLVAIEDEVVLDRIEHLNATGDQLQHVFVVGNHKDIVVLLGGLPCQRADYIVGFETLGLQNRNAKSFQAPGE